MADTDAPTPKVLKKAGSGDAKGATQTTFGCSHTKGLLTTARQPATDRYKELYEWLQKEGNVTDRIHKLPGPQKEKETRATAQVTYLCLQCPNTSLSRERHTKGHAFAVESSSGIVFCHECRDFVYDPAFEDIRLGASPSTDHVNRKKRKRAASPMLDADKKLLSVHSVSTPCAATGLRGLYNMGQTCFMSVILQSLIHNPLIRTYYLSEGHKSSDCDREACTSCALDDILLDFFAQEKHEGYGAVHMLQGCWKGGGGLAGYSQQDAHEFLGFILNSLHEANVEDEEKKDSKDCQCIIHQTFAGLYKSTVTCRTCKNNTITMEPFMDLGVDVETEVIERKEALGLINGTRTIKERLPTDVAECLRKYTSTEKLGSDSYHCRNCDASREASKKISLVRLPPVIPIHLKRFSHSKSSAQSNKVDAKVHFPLTLDMAPYVTSKPSEKASGTEHILPPPIDDDDDDDDDEETIDVKPPSKLKSNKDDDVAEPNQAIYELSSVVVHKGKIDNGHYISYSKQGTEWFRFDDSMVVQVDEKEVLSAEAYMLFYVVAEF